MSSLGIAQPSSVVPVGAPSGATQSVVDGHEVAAGAEGLDEEAPALAEQRLDVLGVADRLAVGLELGVELLAEHPGGVLDAERSRARR